ncbi:WD40-repeat-containing domain protein [Gorgonomyces haynaldii]|nr:WD40-repeat-containing domain protein [Gorgonomyces haynaldii]
MTDSPSEPLANTLTEPLANTDPIDRLTKKDSQTEGETKENSDQNKRVKRKYTKKSERWQLISKEGKLKRQQELERLKFDAQKIQELLRQYPQQQQTEPKHDDPDTMISYIDQLNPLKKVHASIKDRAPITGMRLSMDGSLLATFCNGGSTKIWETVEFKLVQVLEDTSEENIDEFYVGSFTPQMTHILIGGKLKDRKRWSEADNDNHVMGCPVKVFDLMSGKVVCKIEAHEEEILALELLEYKGESYFITGGQDGYIQKYKTTPDYTQLVEKTRFVDGSTCMAFTISFLPKTGNRYFAAACDEKIRIFDFEEAHLLQSFDGIYSYYCDCAKFVQLWDYPSPPENYSSPMFQYLISRGVEVLDAEGKTINSIPNKVTLHKLIYPTIKGGDFVLEKVKEFHDQSYFSNSWLIKICSNGRYVAAPTFDGNVFLFHLKTGKVAAILRDHQEIEVRDVLFHPTRKLFFTCADGSLADVRWICERLSSVNVACVSRKRETPCVKSTIGTFSWNQLKAIPVEALPCSHPITRPSHNCSGAVTIEVLGDALSLKQLKPHSQS